MTLSVFFAVAACSWMPHRSCHDYRLETASSFVVGTWELTPAASALHMPVYTVRLVRPFRFEVFDLPWSMAASAREVAIVIGFGVLCCVVAWRARSAARDHI